MTCFCKQVSQEFLPELPKVFDQAHIASWLLFVVFLEFKECSTFSLATVTSAPVSSLMLAFNLDRDIPHSLLSSINGIKEQCVIVSLRLLIVCTCANITNGFLLETLGAIMTLLFAGVAYCFFGWA